MNHRGALIGNKNASKANRAWANEIRKVVKQKKRLRALAEALVNKAESGDITALREFGDRFDGKVPQALSGPEGGPIIHTIERVIVEKS